MKSKMLMANNHAEQNTTNSVAFRTLDSFLWTLIFSNVGERVDECCFSVTLSCRLHNTVTWQYKIKIVETLC